MSGLPGYEVVVDESRPFSAASARTVRDRDLLLRPRTTPEDVLRVVPGLVLAQHQGGGKADQLFLRGFDADHGTNSDYREAQFGNVSQVIARPARTTGFVPETHPVADVHYTPGNPLGVQVAVGWKP